MEGSLTPRKLFNLWAPVVFYAVFIFFMSSFSLQFLLFQKVEKNPGDKLTHVVEYGVLGLLLARALWRHNIFRRSARRVFLAALVLGVFYAASDEFHQRFVPYRDCSAADLAADAAGVMFGTVIWIRKQTKLYA